MGEGLAVPSPAASQANSVPRRNPLGSARSRARCMNPANSTGEAGRASPYCAAGQLFHSGRLSHLRRPGATRTRATSFGGCGASCQRRR
jgi:hypothetical protein